MSERGESEAPTIDPIVDPDQPLNRPPRRRRRRPDRPQPKAARPSAKPDPPGEPEQLDLWDEQLPDPEDEKPSRLSTSSSWNSLKGPVKGVKFRGGTPPNPPAWQYDKGDLRAFAKWKKRVEIWMIQIANYVPLKETGILLYNSLKGELEEELEDADISQIYNPKGVEFILNILSRAIETRSVHLKRKLLADYEHLYRHNGEGMRSFINRYQRSERALLSVNIMVEKMYDGEARGARMLERTKLPVEMQRQVLIGTMQSLEFDTVKDALLFQYPDHRAAPPLFGQHHGAPPHHRQPFKGRGKGKDKGAGKGDGNKGKSQAWITDYTNDEQDYQQTDQEYEPNADDSLDIIYEDGPEEDPEDADQEGELDDDQDFDPEEISQILTVTARKLAGMTQARKFRNTGPGNKRSIADRKKSSHCAACGQPGHWKGDPECGASGGASSSTPRHAKGKGGGKDGGKEGKVAKVHFTRLRPGHDELDEQPDQHTSHQVYTISLPPVQHHHMHAPQAAGYVILDTACQRLCAGKEWSQAHATKLSRHRVEAFQVERNEVFEFGSGPPLTSTVTWGIPATFAHNLCILFPCILEAPIPCLASRSLLSTLQAVIDLGRNEVYFGALNATATLHMVNGHIAINILEFTWRDPKLAWWRNHHHDLPRRFGHGELGDEVYVPELTCAQAQIPGPIHATGPKSTTSAAMVAEVETHREDHDHLEPTSTEVSADTYHAVSFDGNLQQYHTGGSLPEDETYGNQAECSDGKFDRDQRLRADRPQQPVHSQVLPEIRQPARQVCPVPGVPSQVAVEQHPRRMGGLYSGLALITIATAFLNKCLGFVLEEPPAGRHTTTSSPGTTPNAFADAAATSFDLLQGQAEAKDIGVTMGVARGDKATSAGATGGDRDGTGRLGRVRPSGVRLGERRRLAGNLKQAAQVLTVEQNVYGNLPSSMDNKSKIDVMEMFAGAAEITHRAPSFGLKSLQPFDFEYGLDLSLEEHQQTWADAQRRFKPLVIIAGIECTKWIIMNENMNYLGRGRMDELRELRAAERPLVTFTTDACWQQLTDGNFFLLENPAPSRLWELPEVHELMVHPEVYVVRGHAGAYGGTTSTGELMKKTFQWVTNSKELADSVSAKLGSDMLYYCKPLLGKELRQSAKYPDALVKSILQGVRVEAQRRFPQRFLKVNEVYVAEPVEDPAAWAEVLRLAQRALVSDSTRGYNVPDDDKIYHIVNQLVPWDIVRVQISRCPVQRRLPRDISYTHRGAVLQYQDGGIEVEHEALDGLHFPKQRFRKAVAYGVFWYGHADPQALPPEPPEQQPQPPQEQQPEQQSPPQPQEPLYGTMITFPGCPNDITRDTKAALARIHLNLGHPSERELIRLLAWQGAISKHFLTALKHMVCASCQRTKLPKKARPSAMPTSNLGQFNDCIQSDVFYCRDVMGVNYAVVGIVDQSTLLHQAARLPDLLSQTMVDIFRALWLRPYGFPLEIRVDRQDLTTPLSAPSWRSMVSMWK